MESNSSTPPLHAALAERWASPDEASHMRLGQALWGDLLITPIGEVVPEGLVSPMVARVIGEGVAREFWGRISRQGIEEEILRMKASGWTLMDVVGEEGAERLRREAQRPNEPNRELITRLLDQPLLRQALKETLQTGLQQFLSQLGESLPFGKSQVGPSGGMARGVIGEVGRGFGRGFARKVKATAAIGKTWMEGMGVGQAFEDQIQPFLASYANKAVAGLTENLMSGDRSELAAEARVNILETLLETPLDELLPEPDLSRIDLRLRTISAIAGHVAEAVVDQPHVAASVEAWLKGLRSETFGEAMERLGVETEAEEALLLALGQVGHGALSRPGFLGWLEEEMKAAGEG